MNTQNLTHFKIQKFSSSLTELPGKFTPLGFFDFPFCVSDASRSQFTIWNITRTQKTRLSRLPFIEQFFNIMIMHNQRSNIIHFI